MAKLPDPLSPESSPSVVKPMGVRRVNHLPLLLVISAFTLFVVIIALVAVKRANQSNLVTPTPMASQTNDSSTMADNVLAGQGSGIIPSAVPTVSVTQLALPVAVLDNPDNPPLPVKAQNEAFLAELSRIQMEKLQMFEKAVKAKTRIELPSQVSLRSPDESRKNALDKLDQVQQRLSDVSDPNTSFQQRLQHLRASMTGREESQTAKSDMALFTPDNTSSGDRWSLGNSVQAPRTPYELRAGAVIPGTMISGISADLPGQVIGQISQNVYDTATGKHLLFPQGTRLLGVYSNDVAYGQESILVAWQRVIFPDGKALDIGSMPGSDSAGNAGFRDEVNHHYVRIFGQALLMSAVVAGVTYSQQPSNQTAAYGPPSAGSVMSAAMGQQLGEVSAQMIAKNMNIAPLNKIRAGYRFNITVVKDITFTKPYHSFDY